MMRRSWRSHCCAGTRRISKILSTAVKSIVAEPRESADARHVDHAIDDHAVVDMHAHHLAEAKRTAAGLAVRRDELDGLVVEAFERDRRAFDPRRFHDLGRYHLEPGKLGLAHVLAMVAAGDVHLGTQIIRGEIEHELARALGVALRVLAPGRGEQHERRLGRHDVEEAVGREIDHAGRADGGDPADRARHHQAGAGIVLEVMRLGAGIVVHAGSVQV